MEYSNRLSDRILSALQLCVDQKDADIAELLARALELSITRSAGGKDFTERRSFDDDIREALEGASELKDQ